MSSPVPLASMAPPSSTTGCPSGRVGVRRRWPVMRSTAAPTSWSQLVVVVLGPRVERPVDQHDVAFVVVHERRRGVAQPDAIVGHDVEPVAVEGRSRARELLARALAHFLVMAEDLHALVAMEHAHDLGVHPRNRLEFAGPVGLVVGPGDPGGGVRRPFRRHPKPGWRMWDGGCAENPIPDSRFPLPASCQVPTQDSPVRIHAPVAQERPVAPRLFDQRRVALGNEHLRRLRPLRR